MEESILSNNSPFALSIIFSSFSSIIKKEDEEKHRRICANMRNPPQKLLDAHREYRNGGAA